MVGDATGGAAREPGFPLAQEESDGFAARSAPLGAILRGDEATRIVEAYEREDQRALDRQNRFFLVAGRLNRTVLTTAVVGALILALGVLRPWLLANIGWAQFDQVFAGIVAALGLLGILVGGYAAALLYELNAGDLEGDWMQSRARAEKLRSEYFDRLVARAAKSDSATQAAAFDLVRTHLLQSQLGYFAERGRRHEADAGHWLRLAAFAHRRRLGGSGRRWHGRCRGRAFDARHRGAWRDRHGRRVFRHIAGGDRPGTGAGAALPQQC